MEHDGTTVESRTTSIGPAAGSLGEPSADAPAVPTHAGADDPVNQAASPTGEPSPAAPAAQSHTNARHPARESARATGKPTDSAPILELRSVTKVYREGTWPKARHKTAIADVSIRVPRGVTVGVVGRSGSGKTTMGRIAAGLEAPTRGIVLYKGRPLSELARAERAGFRQSVAVVFQDPVAALNPRMTVKDLLLEPYVIQRSDLLANKSQMRGRVLEMMEEVGLPKLALERHPRELSGGQCQRVGIARAFALRPELVVCDEALSALDPEVSIKILELLQNLKTKYQTSYLFITHDLSVAKAIADSLYVFHEGQVVAEGSADEVMEEAAHPAVANLKSAILTVGEHRFLRERI